MSEQRSDAYCEGQEAASQGCNDSDCPYEMSSGEAMDWPEGLANVLDSEDA